MKRFHSKCNTEVKHGGKNEFIKDKQFTNTCNGTTKMSSFPTPHIQKDKPARMDFTRNVHITKRKQRHNNHYHQRCQWLCCRRCNIVCACEEVICYSSFLCHSESSAEHEDYKNITGIQSIPDGILIVYNRDLKNPIQVNLIEYECYGEKKIKILEKSNYFNGQIIPQLMKFASTFSIVTDRNLRQNTIDSWVSKMIGYINSSPDLEEKFSSWVLELEPSLSQKMIGLKMSDYLKTLLKII